MADIAAGFPPAQEIAELAMTAMAMMMIGDGPRYADAVMEIVELGDFAVHVALIGWMEFATGLKAATGDDPDGFWGLEAVDVTTGRRVSADAVGKRPMDRGYRDAMRIATCYANGDHATVSAIIDAAARNGHGEALITATCRIAVEVAKSMKEQDGD